MQTANTLGIYMQFHTHIKNTFEDFQNATDITLIFTLLSCVPLIFVIAVSKTNLHPLENCFRAVQRSYKY